METASLSTLSPNTNMFRVGSRLRAWNIASVATGSTADMRDPNVKLTDKREREKNYLWPYSVVNYIVLQYVECNCFTTSDICPVDTLHPSVEEKTQQGLVNWTVCTTDHSQCIESSSDNSSTDGSLAAYTCTCTAGIVLLYRVWNKLNKVLFVLFSSCFSCLSQDYSSTASFISSCQHLSSTNTG